MTQPGFRPTVKDINNVISLAGDTKSVIDQITKTHVKPGETVNPELVTPTTAQRIRQTSADAVYQQSASNVSVSTQQAPQPSNVVVAPTTNVSNNSTHNIVRIPSRNADPIISDYYRSRYAF